jgi:hypothetical protein
MEANLGTSDHLNEQQVLMLRLLKTPLPEKDFLQIRKLAVKLLSKKLDKLVEGWEDEKNIQSGDYEKLSEGHFRSKL